MKVSVGHEVVKKTWGMTAKIAGAIFGTIVAPLLVAVILKLVDRPPPAEQPAVPATGEANAPPAKTVTVASASGLSTPNTPSALGGAPGLPPVEASPRPPVKLVAGKPVDLLAAVDLKRDVLHGRWEMRDGALQLPRAPDRHFSMLRLPVDPPDEYDLLLSVSRSPGVPSELPLFLVLAVDGHQAGLLMDAPGKGKRFWGLEMIDGKPAPANGTAAFDKPILSAAVSRVVVKVRRGGVTLTANDTPVLDWRGRGEQFSLPKAWTGVPTEPSLILMSRADFSIQQITLAPGGGDWTSVFNERNLKGWTGADLSRWKVDPKNAILAGFGEKQANWLFSEREYRDFRLRCEFSLTAGTDSGLALRAASVDPERDHLQVELRDDVHRASDLPTGALRNGGAGKGKQKSVLPAAPAQLKPVGEWNELEVELSDDQLRVWINGLLLQDADLAQSAQAARAVPALKRPRGSIGFQVASGELRLRKILLHELKR